MIKIYARSITTSVDAVSKNMLLENLIQLISKHEQLEFWFTSCRTDFDSVLLETIISLRQQYPHKIDTIAIVDPIKNLSIDDFCERDYNFPPCSITRIQYAPLIQGKCEQYEERYIMHFRKIESWIISQCDLILAYYYPDIPHRLTLEIQRLKRRKTIITIYNPDIAQALLLKMEALDERPRKILLELKAGSTYTSIAKEYGVSASRIRQQSTKIIRNIFKEIEKDFQ